MGENDGQAAGLPMTLKVGWVGRGPGLTGLCWVRGGGACTQSKGRGRSRKEGGGGQAARGAQERMPSRGRDRGCPWLWSGY